MPISDVGRLPLSSRQAAIWSAQRLDPFSVDFHVAEYIEIRGRIDPALLEAAARSTIAETDALNVRFVSDEGGRCWQIPCESPLFTLSVVDLCGRLGAVELAVERMRAMVGRPVDLARGAVLDNILFRIEPELYFWCTGLHHIVCDGASAAMFIRRAAELYTAMAHGTPVTPYAGAALADIVAEDNAYRESQAYVTDAGYWCSRLADALEPVTVLRDPGKRPCGRVARQEGVLDHALTGLLKDSARRARTRWPVVVIAAVAAYVHRMTGAHDLVLGIPVSGRSTPAARRTRGMFSTILPLRLRLGTRTPVEELVRTTSQALREALRHQRFPLNRLPVRTTAGRPWAIAVNVMAFDYRLSFAGAPATAHNLTCGDRLDYLSINLFDRLDGEPPTVQFEADAACLVGDELAVHHRRFSVFLERMAAATGKTTVGELDVLAPGERAWLLAVGHGATAPVPDRCLHELFEEQALRRPDALAVYSRPEEICYRELNTRANELAWRLRGLIDPGQAVGLAVERSIGMVVGILAVLKAGGCYVPLDRGMPAERLAFIVGDAAIDLAVVGAGPHDRLPAGLTLIPVSADQPARGPVGNPPPVSGPDAPAYLLYTSGSTGSPKGVVVRHSCAVNFTLMNLAACGLGEGTRFLGFSPVTFDMSILEIFGALLGGGTLVLATEDERLDVDRLQELITDRQAAVADLPPALLPLLDSDSLPSLTLLTVGGEKPSRDIVDRWTTPTRQVWNTYGPTETTVVVTMHRCAPVADGSAPPIGRPTANHRVYVVDRDLRLLPPEVPGELCVAGPGVAKGYLADPALTAESFVADPWSDAPGSRMYRTGDLVRWLPRGELEFLGRLDQQVKINGQRIELGEIEAALGRCPGVEQAIVLVHHLSNAGAVLVAYYVGGDGVGAAELRDRLTEVLPRHMVPHHYVPLERIPLTPHGKVDRKALAGHMPTAATDRREPATDREKVLCSLLGDILGLPAPSANQDVFALGGDSITALALVSRARAAGFTITIADVFEHRTVAALAAALPDPVLGPPSSPDREPGHGDVPPTPMTRWLGSLGGPRPRYAQSALVHVPPDVDLGRLTAAARALVEHHDVLRTRTRGSDENWTCTITPPEPPPAVAVRRVAVRRADLAAVVTAETKRAINRLDPARGAVLEAVWFDTGSTEPGQLLLVLHHLVVDGVSWRIVLADLATAWEAVARGRPVRLPPVPTSFRTWARHQGILARDPAVTAELPFWCGVLREGATPFERDPAPEDTRATAENLTVTLPSAVAGPLLTTAADRWGTGPTELMLAALALAVARWQADRTGRHTDELLVDLEGHGRDDERISTDITRTVGWFTAQFPVRLVFGGADQADIWSDETALAAFVRRVHDAVHTVPSTTGFGLLRHLNTDTAPLLAGLARPQVLLNYLGRVPVGRRTAWSLAAENEPMGVPGDTAMPVDHVLEINAIVRDHTAGCELTAVWTWPRPMLARQHVAELAMHWLSALRMVSLVQDGENV